MLGSEEHMDWRGGGVIRAEKTRLTGASSQRYVYTDDVNEANRNGNVQACRTKACKCHQHIVYSGSYAGIKQSPVLLVSGVVATHRVLLTLRTVLIGCVHAR